MEENDYYLLSSIGADAGLGSIFSAGVAAGAEAMTGTAVTGVSISHRYFGFSAVLVVRRLRPSPISKAMVHPDMQKTSGITK
jgi:hypothetical protein